MLVTAPRFGATVAVLLEAPVILTASWYAARGCVAAFAVPPRAAARLAMGAFAFGLTMLAELALAVLLFGRTVPEHFAAYRTVAGDVGLAAQVVFAVLPYAQARRRDIR
ncbi:hypothetical protein [Phenylobacterium sp.]|uniref:hypothetical protein n=1 Tax=Phenylobacterium sp. TaxID=1871053 RepID=UPI0025D4DCF7|nr:hypothetical protein [Phenylobacterium sp.]